jgi:hypothetical protein
MFIRCWALRHTAGQGTRDRATPGERAGNRNAPRWAEVFGDDVVAAMTDRGQFQPSKTGHFRPPYKSDGLLPKGMLGLVYYSDSSRPPDPVSTKRGQAQ